MPPDYFRALDKLEALRTAEPPKPDRVGAIYALVGFGCLAIIMAIVLERM